MGIESFRRRLRADLESQPAERQIGRGWISGVGAMICALSALFLVLALRFPALLSVPGLRSIETRTWFRVVVHLLLLISFMAAGLNLVLRPNRILGLTAIGITLLAAALGGSQVQPAGELTSGLFLGLDWFVLNVVLTGLLFVPLEKLFPLRTDQPLFRSEWRDDLFYYFVSSMLVQCLTWLSLGPSRAVLATTSWEQLRTWVAAQPPVAQFVTIMFLTDFVQYWLHRAFHQIPWLWKFHAVHHSARSMDWLAGARMHFLEIIALRGFTVMPMLILGFRDGVVQAYILAVYFHSTLVHANLKWNLDWLGWALVTPRFHHWHHGIEREAIDVNFAIHFPVLDRLFGTLHWPRSVWPGGYGIGGHPVPTGYWPQFLYPFRRRQQTPETSPPPAGE